MSGIGVVTNPRSRANQGNRLERRLRSALGPDDALGAPEDLAALETLLAGWRREGRHTVVVNGGDGTVHRVVTAMVRTWGDALPRLGVLPAGTMNIIANSVGVRGRPRTVLRRLVSAGAAARTVRVSVMRFDGDGAPVYGFLFGNGIVARFLEVYYEGSEPSPSKAAWILGRGALSAMVGGPAIRRLTRPFEGTVTVDGQVLSGDRWTAVAAGTVEQLGLGFRAFHLAPGHPGRMHLQAVGGSVVDLARDLPRIYRGVPPARPGNRELTAVELLLQSHERIGYMVDGDFYTADRRLTVTVDRTIEIAVV